MSGISTFAAASSDLSVVRLVLLSLGTMAVGLIGGLVGIALGVVRLPLMTGLGIDPFVAGPINLAANFTGSLAASFPHFYKGRIVWRVVLLIGLPSVAGAFVGGRYAGLVPGWILLLVVAFLLVWSGLFVTYRASMELRKKGGSTAAADRLSDSGQHPKYAALTPKTIAREGAIGVVIGIVGGAVGLALGVLRMPALVSVFKMDPLYAAGTNLVMTVLISTSGFAGHSIRGQLDWKLFAIVSSISMVSMYVGAQLAGRISAARLRLFIGIVLVGIAPLVVVDAVGRI